MPELSMYSLLMKNGLAHEEPVYSCAWTVANLSDDDSDGPKDIIATSGLIPNIKVWMWEDKKLKYKQVLKGHAVTVTSLAFSPDGQTLVSTSMDFSLMVWDMMTGRNVHKIRAPEVWRTAFAPDGIHVVAGCHTDHVIIYNVAEASKKCVFDTRVKYAISVAWSANNNYIACGTLNGTVCILDAAHGKVIHTFTDHKKVVKNIAFSPNSKLLATASIDCTLKLFDVVAGTMLHSYKHTNPGTSVCFSSDGKRIAFGTSEGEVVIAMTDGLHVLKTFKEHKGYVWQVLFSPKEDLVISTSSDKTINVYECPPLAKK